MNFTEIREREITSFKIRERKIKRAENENVKPAENGVQKIIFSQIGVREIKTGKNAVRG